MVRAVSVPATSSGATASASHLITEVVVPAAGRRKDTHPSPSGHGFEHPLQLDGVIEWRAADHESPRQVTAMCLHAPGACQTWAQSVPEVEGGLGSGEQHRSASVNGKVEIAALACAITLSVARGLAQLWLRHGSQALLTVAVFAAQALVSVAAIRAEFNITLGFCNPCFPLGCGDLDGLSPCLLGCAH